MRRYWSEHELQVLDEKYPHVATRILALELGRTERAVYSIAIDRGLRKSTEYLTGPTSGRLNGKDTRGRGSRFVKGHATWNAGSHWTAGGRSAETRWCPGAQPHNTRPLGSYRLNQGMLEQKVSNLPGNGNLRWHTAHRIVWEAANGPLPPGHIAVFKKGRKTAVLEEITLDAIEIVDRSGLMKRNSHYTNYPPEISQLIQLRGALIRQINKRAE